MSLTTQQLPQTVAAGFCEREKKPAGAPEVEALGLATTSCTMFPKPGQGSPDNWGGDVDTTSQWEELQGHITRVWLQGKLRLEAIFAESTTTSIYVYL